jgi:GGDEF domain-containing protein/ABC-type amino acid transport substrate-binding protein
MMSANASRGACGVAGIASARSIRVGGNEDGPVKLTNRPRWTHFGAPLLPLARERRIVVYAAALALVPLLLATAAFGHAFRESELTQTDAKLAAAARVAVERTSAAQRSTLRSARQVARSPAVQRALEADGTSLTPFRRRTAWGPLVVLRPGRTAPPASAALTQTVSIVRRSTVIGRVRASVLLAPLAASLERATGVPFTVVRDGRAESGRLRGAEVDVGKKAAGELDVDGAAFRVRRVPVAPGLELLGFAPRAPLDARVRHRELVVLGAGLLTLAAMALAWLLVHDFAFGGRVAGSSGQRSPVALAGEIVAAAHDPDALLPVLLETAAAAVGAVGGYVVWNGERIASIGAEEGRRPLILALDEGAQDGQRQLVLFPRRGGFSPNEQKIAESLLAQGRIALENARLHGVVRLQAVTDELTDLANRRRFMEALQHEVSRSTRFGQPLALVLFDLDHFKRINDRFGHQAVIVAGTGAEGAAAVAESLRRDLSETVSVGSRPRSVTASFGVAELVRGASGEELVAAADRALYRAKRSGRDTVVIARPADAAYVN